MWGGRRLAVVMPAKDEVQHIGRALGNLPPEVDLVVLVDDGSSDGTAKAAQA
ncbi:MAG TPA: glycosyltransferase family 2 protein, partial [Candidatus Poseidoniales archaeon]